MSRIKFFIACSLSSFCSNSIVELKLKNSGERRTLLSINYTYIYTCSTTPNLYSSRYVVFYVDICINEAASVVINGLTQSEIWFDLSLSVSICSYTKNSSCPSQTPEAQRSTGNVRKQSEGNRKYDRIAQTPHIYPIHNQPTQTLIIS